MKQPSIKNLEAAAAKWNAAHPIGTLVTRYKLIDPLREGTETKTRSEAWVMGGHSVMVMVEGVPGGVLLESVVPINEEVKMNDEYEEQVRRSKEIVEATGYVICTCGSCGSIRLIKRATDTIADGELLTPCYNCRESLRYCDVPDLFY